jgi:hypothetical protein
MNRGVLRRRNALAAAQCVIGTLWFFLLTIEVRIIYLQRKQSERLRAVEFVRSANCHYIKRASIRK